MKIDINLSTAKEGYYGSSTLTSNTTKCFLVCLGSSYTNIIESNLSSIVVEED